MVGDFEAKGRKPQPGDIGVFQSKDIRLTDIIGLARDCMTQFIDIDCWHQFNGWTWFGMPGATAD
jgi:hypothetical protein